MFHNPTTDLIIVLVIVLLFLGPKRLPGLGKSLGQGMREFKDSITGHSGDAEDEADANDKSAITRGATKPDPNGGAGAESTTAPGSGSAELGSDRRA